MRRSLNYWSNSRIQGSGVRVQKNAELRTQNEELRTTQHKFCVPRSAFCLRPAGYTLVEILIATIITLLLMGVVVQLFSALGQSITDSRSILEASERLRSAAARLQMDLKGVTVTMLPPRNPNDGEGYFEYIEGPVTQTAGGPVGIPLPINSEIAGTPTDSSVGDFDDILMFTTRSTDKPFVGRYLGNAVQSDVAEVAWFIRGRTLYRRQLLIRPDLPVSLPTGPGPTGFYASNDISVRHESGSFHANTLSDLTRRECRFAHPNNMFPFDARLWGQYGLPTLYECSSSSWDAGNWTTYLPTHPQLKNTVDFWSNNTDSSSSTPNPLSNDALGYSGARIADDLILTNVIGFDVKAWDPGANQYVDLDAGAASTFFGPGNSNSMLFATLPFLASRVYDTWSTHYENVGLLGLDPAVYPPGRGVNGFDDNSDGVVDDEGEKITSPPYVAPLRGIQVKIRIFEPDSRQIREVTIVQDFLSK